MKVVAGRSKSRFPIGPVVLMGLALAALAVLSAGDIRRYLKMRSM